MPRWLISLIKIFFSTAALYHGTPEYDREDRIDAAAVSLPTGAHHTHISLMLDCASSTATSLAHACANHGSLGTRASLSYNKGAYMTKSRYRPLSNTGYGLLSVLVGSKLLPHDPERILAPAHLAERTLFFGHMAVNMACAGPLHIIIWGTGNMTNVIS